MLKTNKGGHWQGRTEVHSFEGTPLRDRICNSLFSAIFLWAVAKSDSGLTWTPQEACIYISSSS